MLINISPFQSSDMLLAKWQFTLLRYSNSNNVIVQVQAASEFSEAVLTVLCVWESAFIPC